KGKHIAPNIKQALVVPGSGLVKEQAEKEGLDKVFTEAGFEWREPGCSMCLGMNDDQLSPGDRCASTSNRNFEGRQGPGGRTHLVSPSMAAAAAIAGHFVDVRKFVYAVTTQEKPMTKLLAGFVMFAAMCLGLSGCNTVEGAGKDVKAAGGAVEK